MDPTKEFFDEALAGQTNDISSTEAPSPSQNAASADQNPFPFTTLTYDPTELVDFFPGTLEQSTEALPKSDIPSESNKPPESNIPSETLIDGEIGSSEGDTAPNILPDPPKPTKKTPKSSNLIYARPDPKTIRPMLRLGPDAYEILKKQAKAFLLDPNHPERQGLTGTNHQQVNTGERNIKVWNMAEEFLAGGVGDEFWSMGASSKGGKGSETVENQLWYPLDLEQLKSGISNLFMNLTFTERERVRKAAKKEQKQRLAATNSVAPPPPTTTTTTSPATSLCILVNLYHEGAPFSRVGSSIEIPVVGDVDLEQLRLQTISGLDAEGEHQAFRGEDFLAARWEAWLPSGMEALSSDELLEEALSVTEDEEMMEGALSVRVFVRRGGR